MRETYVHVGTGGFVNWFKRRAHVEPVFTMDAGGLSL